MAEQICVELCNAGTHSALRSRFSDGFHCVDAYHPISVIRGVVQVHCRLKGILLVLLSDAAVRGKLQNVLCFGGPEACHAHQRSSEGLQGLILQTQSKHILRATTTSWHSLITCERIQAFKLC